MSEQAAITKRRAIVQHEEKEKPGLAPAPRTSDELIRLDNNLPLVADPVVARINEERRRSARSLVPAGFVLVVSTIGFVYMSHRHQERLLEMQGQMVMALAQRNQTVAERNALQGEVEKLRLANVNLARRNGELTKELELTGSGRGLTVANLPMPLSTIGGAVRRGGGGTPSLGGGYAPMPVIVEGDLGGSSIIGSSAGAPTLGPRAANRTSRPDSSPRAGSQTSVTTGSAAAALTNDTPVPSKPEPDSPATPPAKAGWTASVPTPEYPVGQTVENAQPQLRWQSAGEGASYDVVLLSEGRVVDRVLLSTTRWTVSKPLTPGASYTWRVTVVPPKGESLAKPLVADATFRVAQSQTADPLGWASYLFKTGKLDEAQGEVERLLILKPDNEAAKALLDKIKAARGGN